MVINGEILRNIIDYSLKPLENSCVNNHIKCIKMFSVDDRQYEQINEICDAFSDYNSTKGLLDKYLRLYQLFEDLMVRRSIVPFTQKQELNVRMLTEFKEIKSSENNALQELIRDMLKDTMNKDALKIEFVDAINDLWQNLSNSERTFLQKIYEDNKNSKEKSFDDMLRDKNLNIANAIAYWIYQMRCKIVHNKATETHLTYQNLDKVQSNIISHFLMPMMEMLLIATIAIMPDFIRYSKNSLSIELF